MSAYQPTIGLEIHAELRTKTKMFCDSKNDPDEAHPNTNICPVCLAHPGTLPVINREAVRHVLRVGTALGARLADYTEFDRKNYFYPDLPKGYQLSQYAYPLVAGGELAGVHITRVHLEEDTASSAHDDATGETAIDYNRAGVPLMELVTEPVITSAEEAGNFAKELQLLLRTLGASEAHMEKGQMRVEANVSIGKDGVLGTKVEIKNLNSFNAMERAVRYEIARQTKLLEEGGKVEQQTLGWDEVRQATFPQRSKEGSADYRYFPDPDLPSIMLSQMRGFDEASLRATLPELPGEKRARYFALGIKAEDADSYVRDERYAHFVDALSAILEPAHMATASNYIANDVVKIVRDIETRDSKTIEKIPMSPEHFAELIRLLASKKLSSRAAKDVLLSSVESGDAPEQVAQKKGLLVEVSEDDIRKAIEAVLAENASVADEYRAGKGAALEYLLGQCMKALRGAGDPVVLRRLIQEALG